MKIVVNDAKGMAATKLQELSNSVNPKLGLPKNEIETRMKAWNL